MSTASALEAREISDVHVVVVIQIKHTARLGSQAASTAGMAISSSEEILSINAAITIVVGWAGSYLPIWIPSELRKDIPTRISQMDRS
jgi:hypothetical protein